MKEECAFKYRISRYITSTNQYKIHEETDEQLLALIENCDRKVLTSKEESQNIIL